MSAESLRARLEAATPGTWEISGEPGKTAVGIRSTEESRPGIGAIYGGSERNAKADADLIAHTPTDLRLALGVIEAAKHGYELAQRYNTLGGEERMVTGRLIDEAGQVLKAALDAFEAAP